MSQTATRKNVEFWKALVRRWWNLWKYHYSP